MPDIIEEIVRLRERGERMAVASLVWSTGSIPMSDRAKTVSYTHLTLPTILRV